MSDAQTTSFVFKHLLHKDANLKKLKTKEDPYHIHKTLGILSICSFIYRYGYVYPTTGSLGFDGLTIDWLTMAIHTALALSSVLFRVPKKRIVEKPMVIYEEYRQHAQLFTLRCTSIFVVATLFPESPGWVAPVVVMAHHLVADRITAIHGSDGNTAVRSTSDVLDSTSTFYKKVAKLYSFYQFLAIASHILPNDRLADMAYNAIIAIQSSAFMMTLYRKRIVRGKTHMAVYATCLVISAFHIIRSIGVQTTLLVAAAFYTRCNLPRAWGNKYLVWTTFLIVYWAGFTSSWSSSSWLPLEGHQMPVLHMPDAGVLKGFVTAGLVYGAAQAERVLGAEGSTEATSVTRSEGTTVKAVVQ